MSEEFPCPYFVGARYHLELVTGQSTLSTHCTQDVLSCHILVTVVQAFQPFTISPVLKVKLDSTLPTEIATLLPSIMILKLFDRRFANDLREYHSASKVSHESEMQYKEFIKQGGGAMYDLIGWEDKRYEEEEEEIDHPDEETEAYLDSLLLSYYNGECSVYGCLSALQGKRIPRFIGKTRFLEDPIHPETVDTSINGILISFIPGENVSKSDPSLISEEICNACIETVDLCSESGVLNQDIRLENFIIPERPCRDPELADKPAIDLAPVVMIDFAQCRLRRKDESGEEWKRAKWSVDEEGAVGYALQKKFGWQYKPSYKYMVPADEEE